MDIGQLGAVVTHSRSVPGTHSRSVGPGPGSGAGAASQWKAPRMPREMHPVDAGDRLPFCCRFRSLPPSVQMSGAGHCALHLVAHVINFFLVSESLQPSVYLFYMLFLRLDVSEQFELTAAPRGGGGFPGTLPRSCAARRPWLQAPGPRVACSLQLTN